MNSLSSVAAMIPGPYGAISSVALKGLGTLTNAAFVVIQYHRRVHHRKEMIQLFRTIIMREMRPPDSLQVFLK